MMTLVRTTALPLAFACAAATATAQDQYADFNGVKIRYIDRGKGEAIVLLHGGTSSLDSGVRTGIQGRPELVAAIRAFIGGWKQR